MKKLNKHILVGLLVFTLPIASCKKDFLEIQPKGLLIADNTQDYEQLLNASYFQSLFTAAAYMGDEMAAQQSYFDGATIRTQRLFQYQDRIYDANQIPTELQGTNTYIPNLYLYNKVINEVMKSKNGTDQAKRKILAEAKVGRAICNLMFQSDFALPYNPATAGKDLGIPLITVADVTQTKFSRATNQATFEFILKDLTEALPDLDVLTHRRKICKADAQFYLARTYMYMQNFTAARTAIDGAFAEITKSNIPLALYDYNVTLNPSASGNWLPDFGFGPSGFPLAANNSQLLLNVGSNTFFANSANTFVISPQTAALYDPADWRLSLLSDTELFGSFVFPRGMRRFPFFFVDIGPSLPDMYLMRAELKARANDLAGAKADLEALRVKRLPAAKSAVPNAVSSDQVALVKFVLDERIREFATTGLRWWDMRRLSVDPVYNSTVNYTHTIYDNAGNAVATYKLKPERFALKFGELTLAQDQGLEENP